MAIRLTESEYEKLVGGRQGGVRNKYRNRKVEFDGIRFDSEHERDCYAELKLMERAGEISDLKTQPVFKLVPSIRENGRVVQRAISYKADFSYIKEGELHVVDAKGVKTDVYKLKKKLMRSLKGIEIEEV